MGPLMTLAFRVRSLLMKDHLHQLLEYQLPISLPNARGKSPSIVSHVAGGLSGQEEAQKDTPQKAQPHWTWTSQVEGNYIFPIISADESIALSTDTKRSHMGSCNRPTLPGEHTFTDQLFQCHLLNVACCSHGCQSFHECQPSCLSILHPSFPSLLTLCNLIHM